MDKKHGTSKTAKPSRASPRTQLPSQSTSLSYNTSVRRNTSSKGIDDSKSNNESMREDSSILEESYDNGNLLENRSKESAELLALKKENEALMEKLKLAEQDKKKAQDSESKLNFKVTALEQEKQEAKADLTKTKSILQIVQISNSNLLQEMEKLKSSTSTAKSFAEVEKLKREKDELTPKNDNLRREIVSFQSAKSSLEKEEKKLKETVQELRQQKEEVSKDLSNLKSELEKLKVSHNNAVENNAKNDVESIRILTLSLKEESTKLEAENKQLKSKIEEIGRERDASKDEVGVLTRQLGEFKAIIARNLQEIKELNQHIASLMKKEDTEKLLKERDELKTKSEKFRKEAEDLKKYKVATQMEVAYLKGKVADLEKSKEEAQANLVKAKNASQIHQVNNSNLMQEIEKLKLVKSPTASFSEMDNLRRERDDLAYKIIVLKNDSDSIKNEKTVLETETKQLKDRVQELEVKKEEVNMDLGRLRIEFEKLQASNNHSIQELDRISVPPKDDSDTLSNRDKTEVKDDTESLRLLTSTLENEKSKLETENTQLRERVDKLEQQKEEVSSEMVKATNHLDDAKAKIAQKLQEVEDLQHQINLMVRKEEAEMLRKERDMLHQTNEGLKKDAGAIKKEKESLASRLVQLEEKVQKLEKKKEEMKSIFVAQCEKVFTLLNLNGTETIKQADFTEIVKGCALIQNGTISDQELNVLFQGLDSDKNEEITLSSFLKVVTDDDTRSKYTQLIESVLRKEKDIVAFKNRKNNNFDSQPKSAVSHVTTLDTSQDGWVERSREIEVKPKEAEKTIKLKAFLADRKADDLHFVCKTEESESTTPLYLNSPTADSFLTPERMMKSQTPTSLAGGITWQSRLERSEIQGASQTPSAHNRGRGGTRLFGDDKEKKIKRTSSAEPIQISKLKVPDRGQRLEERVEQFFKALGHSKGVDVQTKMELKMCLQDLPDRELFKMNSLARSERIGFLSYVIERFKIQARMGAQGQGAQKMDNLEKILEKERNQLVIEQEEIRKLRIMGLVGLNPLMTNFNAMFNNNNSKGSQPKH